MAEKRLDVQLACAAACLLLWWAACCPAWGIASASARGVVWVWAWKRRCSLLARDEGRASFAGCELLLAARRGEMEPAVRVGRSSVGRRRRQGKGASKQASKRCCIQILLGVSAARVLSAVAAADPSLPAPNNNPLLSVRRLSFSLHLASAGSSQSGQVRSRGCGQTRDQGGGGGGGMDRWREGLASKGNERGVVEMGRAA